MKSIGRWGPVASAGLLGLALWGVWPLTFVALIPWLLSLQETTPRQAWNRGYAFGLLLSSTQLWWLGDLAYKWTGSALLGILPWLLASSLSAVYYGLLGRLVRSCWAGNLVWAIPFVWAGMEVFRSYIPVFAFPWALLAEPLIAVPDLGAGAWYGTIYLVSALLVAANLALLGARKPGGWRPVAVVMGLFVFATIHFERSRPSVRLAAGQTAVDMAFDPEAEYKIGPAADELIGKAKDVDLLVLPEGISRTGEHPPFRIPEGLPIAFGGQRGTGPVYQSAFAHDAQGWTVADKTRLVIFGEFVPGRDYFPFIGNAFHLPGGDLSAGDKQGDLRMGRHRVGPLICFEALFPDLALRQAGSVDTLAVMSVDDWFAMPARERLAEASQWRAIEAGLPLVRAGSMGRSMIISPFGRVEGTAPFGTRTLVSASTALGRGPFPLVWLFPGLALVSLIAVPLWVRRQGLPPYSGS